MIIYLPPAQSISLPLSAPNGGTGFAGPSGASLDLSSSASEPDQSGFGVATNAYGDGSVLMGKPRGWMAVNDGGSPGRVPVYNPPA